MKYTEEFFIDLSKKTNNFLHFLQTCKFSGSWDTKVDLNQVIKLIANYDFIVNEMKKEINNLKNEIVELKKDEEKS